MSRIWTRPCPEPGLGRDQNLDPAVSRIEARQGWGSVVWTVRWGAYICSTVLCQRPAAPRKQRTFQKGGRCERKRAAQRRASRAAPLDFLDQKGAKTTQRNELRRSRKVSAHDDLIRKSCDSLKLVPRFCTLRTFKTHQTLRLYAFTPPRQPFQTML